MNDSVLQLPSFAKINWNLRILGRRVDGYHEIDSILQTVSLHDDLLFTVRDDGEIHLQCHAPDVPSDNSNLIVRAAIALKEHARKPPGVDISLTKRIPAKGGLGGGSSNAAIALIGLNHLWQVGLSVAELQRIGRSLGSDVPFFFIGGSARVLGTGKDVFALRDLEKIYLIIVTPNAAVSTQSAYAALKAPSLTTTESLSILSSSFAEHISADSDQWALQNDFERVIFEIEPEIKRVKLALLESGAQGGLLAGSGSSVFGIFENKVVRDRALAGLKCENGWRTFSCDTISRTEYTESLSASRFSPLSSPNFQTDTGA